ncbi:MAG: hypothetical protein R2880_22015, partial [Deinococcales bacterium]
MTLREQVHQKIDSLDDDILVRLLLDIERIEREERASIERQLKFLAILSEPILDPELEKELFKSLERRISPEEKMSLWQPLLGTLDNPEYVASFQQAIQRRP